MKGQLTLITIPKQNTELAVLQLRLLGYPLRNIRKSLSKLTGISQLEVSRMIGKQRQEVTNTINGERTKLETQELIARVWQVPREILFEDDVEAKDQA